MTREEPRAQALSRKPPPAESLAALAAGIRQAATLYYQLLLVVGRSGAGKTQALTSASKPEGALVVNVGLELASRLLERTTRQRRLQVQGFLEELVATASAASGVALLDNIEVLFDADLQQDPLRLLQAVSRNRTVVAAWPGTLRGGTLRYAAPPHREYREYPAHDLLTVALEHGDETP